MTQNTNDSINSILQHGRVVDNNCCVVFPISRDPYLIRERKWKVSSKHLLVFKTS